MEAERNFGFKEREVAVPYRTAPLWLPSDEKGRNTLRSAHSLSGKVFRLGYCAGFSPNGITA